MHMRIGFHKSVWQTKDDLCYTFFAKFKNHVFFQKSEEKYYFKFKNNTYRVDDLALNPPGRIY